MFKNKFSQYFISSFFFYVSILMSVNGAVFLGYRLFACLNDVDVIFDCKFSLVMEFVYFIQFFLNSCWSKNKILYKI